MKSSPHLILISLSPNIFQLLTNINLTSCIRIRDQVREKLRTGSHAWIVSVKISKLSRKDNIWFQIRHREECFFLNINMSVATEKYSQVDTKYVWKNLEVYQNCGLNNLT